MEPSIAKLSPREREVVSLVAQGKSNLEIGQALFLSEGTVKTHLRSIRQKTGFVNRVQIALWANEQLKGVA